VRESLHEAMAAQRYRFGLFEFDVSSGELRREGALVRLQSQPAQVLGTLLAHADQVVSREELRLAVWREDTFVDFERGLNFCIAQIRAALNDNAAEPRFIRTIPKRGYQFIAPVARVGESESAESTAIRPMASVSSKRIAAVIIACILLTALLAGGYALRVRMQPSPIVAVLRFDNETGNPEMTRFSDAVSDLLVAELTSRADGHYRVIGNASILRLPRDQRDLNAVASSLGASYVILGQVQSSGDHTRILAHLIHLPEQTHVWVARIEQSRDDPLSLESQVAQTVASQFSPRIRPKFTALVSHPAATL
jgi:DNA-binding winged helix-turn-helix (wHTH) protein/TolB-like protein